MAQNQGETMAIEQPDYFSYLLRLWRVSGESESQPNAKAIWRASLEHPHTHQQQGFASLEHLFEFLREQTEVAPGTNRKESKTD